MNAHLQYVSVRSAHLFDVAMNIPLWKMRRSRGCAWRLVSLHLAPELMENSR